MAAVRADRLRGRHAQVFVAEGDSRFLTRTLSACGHRRDLLGADLRRTSRLGHHAPVQQLHVVDAAPARP